MAEHLAVRPVEGTDIPEVLRLWETSRSITASIPDQPDFVRQLIEHTEDALLVAELDGPGIVEWVSLASWYEPARSGSAQGAHCA